MSASDLPLDPKTVERMGYDNMVAATCHGEGPDLFEAGIVAPLEGGKGPFGDKWAVVVHFGCDPERTDLGSSGVTDHESLDEASDEFRSVVAEHAPDAPKP